MGGCDGGIMQRRSGVDATRDDHSYVTVSTAAWAAALIAFSGLSE